MEEQRDDTENSLGGFIGGSIVGSTSALVALIDALSQQPGIDGEKLIRDFMDQLPARGAASPGAELVYESIEGLLGSDDVARQPPPLQTE